LNEKKKCPFFFKKCHWSKMKKKSYSLPKEFYYQVAH